MNKISLPILFILLALVSFSVLGQNTPTTPGPPAGAGTPAGAGDRNLSDGLRKMNSVEIERMKREMEKDGSAPNAAINTKVESKFPEIKEDFEGIQIAEAAIIKTYTTEKIIDYGLIETSARSINKHAQRLDSNLFAESLKVKASNAADNSADAEEKTQSMRDLIVELDNAIGSFLSSQMFGNLKVVDPNVAVKTRKDLTMIRELSDKLSAEAKKLKK